MNFAHLYVTKTHIYWVQCPVKCLLTTLTQQWPNHNITLYSNTAWWSTQLEYTPGPWMHQWWNWRAQGQHIQYTSVPHGCHSDPWYTSEHVHQVLSRSPPDIHQSTVNALSSKLPATMTLLGTTKLWLFLKYCNGWLYSKQGDTENY